VILRSLHSRVLLYFLQLFVYIMKFRISLWLVLSPTTWYDRAWYGENTDQRGTRTRFFAGNTP